jgi:hypothetical protein
MDKAAGELADFAHLCWYGLRTGFRLSPPFGTGPLIVFRGAELPEAVIESHRATIGKFIAWPAFTSFTTDRKVAEEFARPKSGGVGLVFELKTAGRPRIKSLSAHEREEELILHPFSALRVDAIEAAVVTLTDVVVAQLELLPPMQTNYQLTTVVPAAGRGPARDMAMLKEELAKKDAEIAKLRAEITRMKSANARLTTEGSRLTSEVARIPAFESEIVSLTREVAALKEENSRFKTKLARLGAEATPPRPLQTVTPGTLLVENAPAVDALGLELKAAEPLMAKGGGPWDFGGFKAMVIGKSPVLVLVEFAGGVCGGFAAVPFEKDELTADPTGTSFVFSLRPVAARYALKDKAEALYLWPDCFQFGDGCLSIRNTGDMARREETYAVPSDWDTGGSVKFTRFEIWQVAL